jgi:hypothetical protein
MFAGILVGLATFFDPIAFGLLLFLLVINILRKREHL